MSINEIYLYWRLLLNYNQTCNTQIMYKRQIKQLHLICNLSNCVPTKNFVVDLSVIK
jgi:hypothetical protein